MIVILKIPIVYLAFVVWYAIKAEPRPDGREEDASVWRPWQRPGGPRPRRGGPHGSRDSLRTQRARRDRVVP